MKIKTSFLKILAVVLLISLALSACTANAINLPEKQVTAITLLIVGAVSYLFTKAVTLLPFLKFLDPYREPVALALAAYLINLLEESIPAQFEDVTVATITLILAILSLFGFFQVFRAKGFKGFRDTR